jgi:hypothetical protein
LFTSVRSIFAVEPNSKDSLNQILKGEFSDQQKVDAHYALAKLYAKSESAELVFHFFQGQKLAKEISYHKGIAELNYLMVEAGRNLINQDSQIYLLNEARQSYFLASMPKEEAMALNHLGILFERQGQYRLAMKNYYSALFIFQNLSD